MKLPAADFPGEEHFVFVSCGDADVHRSGYKKRSPRHFNEWTQIARITNSERTVARLQNIIPYDFSVRIIQGEQRE